jgi:hypothetical protein
MKSIFLCRSFRVKGIRVILAALVVIGLAAAISMPALARQDISAGNPMQMKDTYENPLGDGGLRGDPGSGEGKTGTPDRNESVAPDPRPFESQNQRQPISFSSLVKYLRSLCESESR